MHHMISQRAILPLLPYSVATLYAEHNSECRLDCVKNPCGLHHVLQVLETRRQSWNYCHSFMLMDAASGRQDALQHELSAREGLEKVPDQAATIHKKAIGGVLTEIYDVNHDAQLMSDH